jgi:homeobox-leucine zipper protein
MNFDDTSNTWLQLDLDLGLTLHDHFDDHGKRESKKKRVKNPSKCIKAYPMLTLGPSKEESEENTKIQQHSTSKTESCDQNLPTQFTSASIESSFSNSTSIRKESGEEFEVEIEKVPITRIGNVDKDGSPRKKLRLTKQQSEVLEENFKEHSTLNPVP